MPEIECDLAGDSEATEVESSVPDLVPVDWLWSAVSNKTDTFDGCETVVTASD